MNFSPKNAVIATGSYLPQKILTNSQISEFVETNDEWIKDRTGIKQRHIAAEDELTSDLAYKAAHAAITSANIEPTSIDLVIVATTTPDATFPSVATKVQAKLGIIKGAAFDVQAVCAGFIYALTLADSLIKTGTATRALIIGAEKMSSIIDWQDRSTCVLFGDGAGAVIIDKSKTNSGIIGSNLQADGRYGNILYTDGGVSSTQKSGVIKMLGREVYKHAVEKMYGSICELLSAYKITPQEVDVLVPHQANIRILETLATKLAMPSEKLVITLATQANTSAATIPLALDHAVHSGQITQGKTVLLTAIGGGLCWGSILMRW